MPLPTIFQLYRGGHCFKQVKLKSYKLSRQDTAEILLMLALSTNQEINQSTNMLLVLWRYNDRKSKVP